jgi:hypothetical protein
MEALWQRFQNLTVYGQAKVLVLAAYLAIVVATVAVAAPADDKTNQVGARIMALDGDMVVGRYFVVTNDSRSHWYDVTFEIDGGYVVDSKKLVQSGEKVTLFLKDFKRDETVDRKGVQVTRKVSAPLDLQVHTLIVRTRDGTTRGEIRSK